MVVALRTAAHIPAVSQPTQNEDGGRQASADPAGPRAPTALCVSVVIRVSSACITNPG